MTLHDVTLAIKTFRRPSCLAAAIDAATAAWPDLAAVLVLDDGPPLLQVPIDPRYILVRTEEDVGISEGRNRLIDLVETPLVVVADDDFLLGPAARLDLLASATRAGHCDLVAGAVLEREGFWNGGWVYEPNGPRLLRKRHGARRVRRAALPGGESIELYDVDQVNNAFVARVDLLRAVRWDSAFKLKEHDDFALRTRAYGASIAYTPASIVEHAPFDPPGYSEIRRATKPYETLFTAKWQIDAIVKEQEWFEHARAVPRPRILIRHR